MLNKLKQRNEQGFTIIEVLIVLAIAGLIMLVVFLAVPQLQRNSRNTQRKDDVSRVMSAVQEVVSNNNGLMTSITAANVVAQLGQLAYYQPTTTYVTVGGAATATAQNATDVDHITIYTKAKCSTMTGGMGARNTDGTTAATTRQYAVVYSTESGSGTVKNCISS